MAVFIVSYDLRQPGRDYQPLYNRLNEWRAVSGLESVWFINANTTAENLRDDLLKKMDQNDGLFVGVLRGESAWHNLKNANCGTTLKKWIDG